MLWNSGSFEPGLAALFYFVTAGPSLLAGLSLADRRGQLKPVPEALVDHILQAPGSEEAFTDGRQGWPSHLFGLVSPQPASAQEQRLLAPVEAD